VAALNHDGAGFDRDHVFAQGGVARLAAKLLEINVAAQVDLLDSRRLRGSGSLAGDEYEGYASGKESASNNEPDDLALGSDEEHKSQKADHAGDQI
jgi:hypothetical protein